MKSAEEVAVEFSERFCRGWIADKDKPLVFNKYLAEVLIAYADERVRVALANSFLIAKARNEALEEAARLLESDCSKDDYCGDNLCGYANDIRTLKTEVKS